jgi:coenzyme Q-binding protein COQ10
MSRYRSECTFPFSVEQIFDLVADIERYPEFLPGWVSARLDARRESRLAVEQVVGLGPVRIAFRSEALLVKPERLEIHCRSGPVRDTRIQWSFAPDPPNGCRAVLVVQTTPGRHGLRAHLSRRILAEGAPEVLGHFRRRAAVLYKPVAGSI